MTTQSNFPISADVQGFMLWDKIHCPGPLTAITEDVFCKGGITEGFTAAMDEFASPLVLGYQVLNYYAYAGFVPLVSGCRGHRAHR